MEEARKKIRKALLKNPTALTDRQALENILSDCLADDKLRMRLLMTAYDANIGADLVDNKILDIPLYNRLVKRMEDSFGLSNYHAGWAVINWFLIYNRKVLPEVLKTWQGSEEPGGGEPRHQVSVPNFIHKSKQEVQQCAIEAGVGVSVTGSAKFASSQSIRPGELVDRGTTVEVEFKKGSRKFPLALLLLVAIITGCYATYDYWFNRPPPPQIIVKPHDSSTDKSDKNQTDKQTIDEPEPPPPFDVPDFHRIADKSQGVQFTGIEVDSKVNWAGSTNTRGFGYKWNIDADDADNGFTEQYVKLVLQGDKFKLINEESPTYELNYMKHSNAMDKGWLFEYVGSKKKVPTFEVTDSRAPKDPYKAHLFVHKHEDYRRGEVTLTITFVEKRLVYEGH